MLMLYCAPQSVQKKPSYWFNQTRTTMDPAAYPVLEALTIAYCVYCACALPQTDMFFGRQADGSFARMCRDCEEEPIEDCPCPKCGKWLPPSQMVTAGNRCKDCARADPLLNPSQSSLGLRQIGDPEAIPKCWR